VLIASFEIFQFFIGESYVAALLDFKTANQLTAINYRIIYRAVDFLLDSAQIFRMRKLKLTTRERIAGKSFTGMETRSNKILPVPMGRDAIKEDTPCLLCMAYRAEDKS